MIRPEHPFDIRPDLRKAASTQAESTTAESVIRPKQLVRARWGKNNDQSRCIFLQFLLLVLLHVNVATGLFGLIFL
jgi:hypothetical protein